MIPQTKVPGTARACSLDGDRGGATFRGMRMTTIAAVLLCACSSYGAYDVESSVVGDRYYHRCVERNNEWDARDGTVHTKEEVREWCVAAARKEIRRVQNNTVLPSATTWCNSGGTICRTTFEEGYTAAPSGEPPLMPPNETTERSTRPR